jgi:hypothetical protein
MSSNVANQVVYLRNSREFPEELHQLSVEVDRAYIDIANAVNSRTVGIFPVARSVVTGEAWYKTGFQKQQTQRQVYNFTSTAAINHGITVTNIDQFTHCWGVFTDGTNWYGIIFGSNVAIAGQISFYITPTQITFLSGGGAPALTRGTIVLEWMSNP